mgnify:CR=1 FL=1
MKHTEEYKWYYQGTDSKGKKIFKHYTHESFEDVIDYLDDRGFDYEIAGGGMLWIINKHNERFSYYWSTGRWSSKTKNRSFHYHATGIKDFLDRYIDNDEYLEEQNKKYEAAIEKRKKKDREAKAFVLKVIEDAGEEGIIAKEIRQKYSADWDEGALHSKPRELELEGLIFYRGDKIGRSRIIRHVKYK